MNCPHCRTSYVTTPVRCHVCKAPLLLPGPDVTKIDERLDLVRRMGEALVQEAERYGVVLTIECKPLKPLAMGNHMMVVDVRPERA